MGDAAQITCPNPNCQAPNPETNRFCQQCRTPVPKRYLWTVGSLKGGYKPGKLLAQRYAVKRDRILLDTKPGFVPSYPQDITNEISPYLRLFPYRLHVPQVYGLLPPHKKGQKEAVLLLEQAPILGDRQSLLPNLMPELAAVWKEAAAVRQLNWLWQIAQLWQPFSNAGVAASLLEPKLLRVEGPIVRLLELQQDRGEATLSDLGQVWLQSVKEAKPAIAGFLEQLCQQTIQGEVFPEELVAQLDRALFTIGRSQSRTYQIATSTDTGPTRVRNEDACYPSSDSFYQISVDGQALAVVCDGIGGHEGGNVASNLAIETVVAQAQGWQNEPLAVESSNLDALAELERTVCEANDRISELNDIQGRYDRQRMGTTLVMAAARAHEIYIAHIGDSRVYWITRTGCHQVTLDDDIASREVRLGCAVYREALQQVGSGSLVQALGMSSSKNLHPTVQRFVIDEDCIFLLCSDGLSDNDRVEQYWDTEILPVLEGKLDLPTAAANLIEIGNSQNGHDNVTVALVYCRVTGGESTGITPQTAGAELLSAGSTVSTQSETPDTLKTRLLPTRLKKPSLLPLLGGIALLLGLGGALAYFALGKWGDSPVLNPTQSPAPKPHSPSLASPVKSSGSVPSLSPGSLILVRSSSPKNSPNQKVPLLLYEAPQKQTALGMVPENSVLEIKSKALIEQDRWLKLKLCSISGTISSDRLPGTYNLVKPAQEGWIRQADLEPYISQNSIQQSARLPKCTPGNSSTPVAPNQS